MEVLYVLGGILFLLLLFIAVAYNQLLKLRYLCQESWADIDTELKRRYDLIPNLVETVRGYARHERETLEKVLELRTKAVNSTGSPASQARDENALVRGLKTVFAVAEQYPDLKASKNFLALQQELVNTEDRLQAARRFFNANVRDYNNKVQGFPTNLIAGFFHFQPREFFEIEEAVQRSAPQVGL